MTHYDLETKTLVKWRVVGGGNPEMQLWDEDPVMPRDDVGQSGWWKRTWFSEGTLTWESRCVPGTPGD